MRAQGAPSSLGRGRGISGWILTRALALSTGLCAVFLGYESAHLGLGSPAPVDLSALTPEESATLGPLWVRAQVELSPQPFVVLEDSSGQPRCAWILAAPSGNRGRSTAVAVVEAPLAEEARDLQTKGPVVLLEGISRLPGKDEQRKLRELLASSSLDLAPGSRILEVGRRPGGVLGSMALLFLGLVVSLVSVGTSRTWRLWMNALRLRKDRPRSHEETVAEEIRRRVEVMLNEAWDQVE